MVLNDSSIIAMGAGYFNSDDPLGWLMKTDSNGKMLWSRNYYTRIDIANYFWGMVSTKDGDFIIAGTAWDSTQDMWMLKVDSCGWGVGNSQPAANFVVDSIDITNFTISLQNTSKSACRYKWFFGDGDSAVTINTSHTFADTGMKIITLIAYAGNESDTLQDTIILVAPTIYIECADPAVEVFPNPFNASATIIIRSGALCEPKDFTFALYDILGREVLQSSLQNNPSVIERGNLRNGIYFYLLKENHNIIASGRLMITGP